MRERGKKMEEISMNNEQNKSNGNFGSGFVIGALVGAAIVFFLGTKKGRKILKIISEKGIDNISGMLEKSEKSAELEEIFEEDVEKPVIEKRMITKDRPQEELHKVKRFFKGISRKAN